MSGALDARDGAVPTLKFTLSVTGTQVQVTDQGDGSTYVFRSLLEALAYLETVVEFSRRVRRERPSDRRA